MNFPRAFVITVARWTVGPEVSAPARTDTGYSAKGCHPVWALLYSALPVIVTVPPYVASRGVTCTDTSLVRSVSQKTRRTVCEAAQVAPDSAPIWYWDTPAVGSCTGAE